MKISLLTDIQRERIKEIISNDKCNDKTHQATIRKTKSLLTKEFRNPGSKSLIESLITDLDLLDIFLKNGKYISPTLADRLIMEIFEEYSDDRIKLLVNSVKLRKERKKQRVIDAGLKIKDVSMKTPFPPEYTHVINEGTNKGKLYRLLHDKFMRHVFFDESEYLTQKEMKKARLLTDGTISRELNNLINDGLVECDGKNKPKKYRCVTFPDKYPWEKKE